MSPRACPELVEGFAPRSPALTRERWAEVAWNCNLQSYTRSILSRTYQNTCSKSESQNTKPTQISEPLHDAIPKNSNATRPIARESFAAHASYIRVRTIAKARAIMGGPIVESLSPCKAALFNCKTTFAGSAAVTVTLLATIVNNTIALTARRTWGDRPFQPNVDEQFISIYWAAAFVKKPFAASETT